MRCQVVKYNNRNSRMAAAGRPWSQKRAAAAEAAAVRFALNQKAKQSLLVSLSQTVALLALIAGHMAAALHTQRAWAVYHTLVAGAAAATAVAQFAVVATVEALRVRAEEQFTASKIAKAESKSVEVASRTIRDNWAIGLLRHWAQGEMRRLAPAPPRHLTPVCNFRVDGPKFSEFVDRGKPPCDGCPDCLIPDPDRADGPTLQLCVSGDGENGRRYRFSALVRDAYGKIVKIVTAPTPRRHIHARTAKAEDAKMEDPRDHLEPAAPYVENSDIIPGDAPTPGNPLAFGAPHAMMENGEGDGSGDERTGTPEINGDYNEDGSQGYDGGDYHGNGGDGGDGNGNDGNGGGDDGNGGGDDGNGGPGRGGQGRGVHRPRVTIAQVVLFHTGMLPAEWLARYETAARADGWIEDEELLPPLHYAFSQALEMLRWLLNVEPRTYAEFRHAFLAEFMSSLEEEGVLETVLRRRQGIVRTAMGLRWESVRSYASAFQQALDFMGMGDHRDLRTMQRICRAFVLNAAPAIQHQLLGHPQLVAIGDLEALVGVARSTERLMGNAVPTAEDVARVHREATGAVGVPAHSLGGLGVGMGGTSIGVGLTSTGVPGQAVVNGLGAPAAPVSDSFMLQTPSIAPVSFTAGVNFAGGAGAVLGSSDANGGGEAFGGGQGASTGGMPARGGGRTQAGVNKRKATDCGCDAGDHQDKHHKPGEDAFVALVNLLRQQQQQPQPQQQAQPGANPRTYTTGGVPTCNICQSEAHLAPDCPQRWRPGVVCRPCRQPGHHARDCRAQRRNGANGHYGPRGGAGGAAAAGGQHGGRYEGPPCAHCGNPRHASADCFTLPQNAEACRRWRQKRAKQLEEQLERLRKHE
jgi:hypothetical protein